MSYLSTRIRMRREELGISQDALALACGYTSRSTISKIEAGVSDVNNKKLEKIAKALDTTPEYLLGLETEAYTEEEIELLRKYNSLSPRERKIFDNLIDSFLDSNGK